MPKALCWTGLVIATLVLLLFLCDLAIKQPFGGESMLVDIIFSLSAAALGYISWSTLREQDKR